MNDLLNTGITFELFKSHRDYLKSSKVSCFWITWSKYEKKTTKN